MRRRRFPTFPSPAALRIANAMTQSEVPRRVSFGQNCSVRAGALSIVAFERGRWRLRRTRPYGY